LELKEGLALVYCWRAALLYRDRTEGRRKK
jgi:hypothetical protein